MHRRNVPAVVYVLLVVIALLTASAPPSRANVSASRLLDGSFVPNEILIGLKPAQIQSVVGQTVQSDQVRIAALDGLNQKYAVEEVTPVFGQAIASDASASTYGLAGIFRLTVPEGTDIFTMIPEYQANSAVAYAEPNRIYRAHDVPNDADFNKQWALNNTGQTGGRADADIDAPEAWSVEKGNTSALIAVLDTGVDYNHPDLVGGRVRTDIDKDFINKDDDAKDDHGHGTYVAGIAAANTNDARGIAGVCQGCQVLPVKVLDSEGSGSASVVAQGIQYAATAGAKILSMSLGFSSDCGCSQTVSRAINYAFDRGSLLIAASGNDKDKQRTSFPASSPRVLAVGATDHKDQEADFSNRGSDLDILAPGKAIYSLDRNGSYRSADGTSAATPHVSGVAGLVWSQRPQLSNVEVWSILYQSADDPLVAGSASLTQAADSPQTNERASAAGAYNVFLPAVGKSRTSWGRLNAYRAVTAQSWGQQAAPVDNCTGEPNCAPGCGAEVTLTGATNGAEGLRLLRTFRDHVLPQSTIGQEWNTLYERHRLEVALLLATDSELRAQARAALEQWIPLIQAVTETDSQAILTADHITMAEDLVEHLAMSASPELRADLQVARETLDTGRPFVGRNVGEWWAALMQR